VSLPLEDRFWGDRHGEIFDPFGHRDRDDLDTIWVFEAWRDEAAHRASLDMAAVRGVIERGLPLIAERDGAKLEPVGGVGLD
jgi:hypothetical protein